MSVLTDEMAEAADSMSKRAAAQWKLVWALPDTLNWGGCPEMDAAEKLGSNADTLWTALDIVRGADGVLGCTACGMHISRQEFEMEVAVKCYCHGGGTCTPPNPN